MSMKTKEKFSFCTEENLIENDVKSPIDSIPEKIKAQVISSFPSSENINFVTQLKQIKIQDSVFQNVFCVISLHFVGFFAEKNKGNLNLKLFHILKLTDFELIKNKSFQIAIKTSNSEIKITSNDDNQAIHLSRLIFRNYTLATLSLPKDIRACFHIYDPSLLPLVQIPLSLAQIFQFRYAAICSLNETNYDHSIVQYFHSLVKSNDSIFNLKHLQHSFANKQFIPLFESLTFIPTIYGISCKDSDSPTIFSDISHLISGSCYIKIIKLINCNATSGIDEFASAIESNPNLPLEQLFINDNEFEDLSQLIIALSNHESTLTHLSMTNCGLDELNTELLCQNLVKAKSFKSLKYLGFGGSDFSDIAIESISQYFKNNRNLETLDLSGSSHFSNILSLVPNSSIKNLILSDCDFDDESVEAIAKIVPYISSLDLSGCNLNYLEVAELLPMFGKNQKLLFSIKLNRLNFSKERILPLIRGILLTDLDQWKSIEIGETQITALELLTLQALFLRMPHLEHLSLESNFQEEDASAIESLTELKSLKSLNLANSQLSSIVPQLLKSNIKSINLSSNEIKDKEAFDLVTSEQFECVKLNDNPISDFESIVEAANKNHHLIAPPLKHGLSSIDKINSPFHDQLVNTLGKFNTFQHSSICENLELEYPFDHIVHKEQTLNIYDEDIYDLPKLNSITIEDGHEPQKLKKVSLYPDVKSTFTCDPSEESIDELVNTKISTLKDKVFIAPNGSLPDSSSSDHRKSKQIAAKRQNSNISNTGNSPSLAQSNYNIPVTPLSTADSVIIQKLHETAQPLLESDIELESNYEIDDDEYENENNLQDREKENSENNQEYPETDNQESSKPDSDDDWVIVTSKDPISRTNDIIQGVPNRIIESSEITQDSIYSDNENKSFEGSDQNNNPPKLVDNNNKTERRDNNYDLESAEYNDESENFVGLENNKNNPSVQQYNSDKNNEYYEYEKESYDDSPPNKKISNVFPRKESIHSQNSIPQNEEFGSEDNIEEEDKILNIQTNENNKCTPTSQKNLSSTKSRIPSRGSIKSMKHHSEDDDNSSSKNHKSHLLTPEELKNSPLKLRRSNEDLSERMRSPNANKSKIPGIRNSSPNKLISNHKNLLKPDENQRASTAKSTPNQTKTNPIQAKSEKARKTADSNCLVRKSNILSSSDNYSSDDNSKQRNFFESEDFEENADQDNVNIIVQQNLPSPENGEETDEYNSWNNDGEYGNNNKAHNRETNNDTSESFNYRYNENDKRKSKKYMKRNQFMSDEEDYEDNEDSYMYSISETNESRPRRSILNDDECRSDTNSELADESNLEEEYQKKGQNNTKKKHTEEYQPIQTPPGTIPDRHPSLSEEEAKILRKQRMNHNISTSETGPVSTSNFESCDSFGESLSKRLRTNSTDNKNYSEESLNSINDFIDLTSSLLQMQKKKKHKHVINPLILVFSPPVINCE